ncbi:MAG: hypothetical protein H7A23_04925 [Leptospiraceae bacterium]|nr:hypothetical protein [Leptospiraceae bacterium]MCP5493879.1 hypothetical protein [Leptospiraceae bacterium]
MAQNKFIRVWTNFNIEALKKNILLIDDLYGTCGNCKQLGLNYTKDKKCPKCGCEFKYLATNSKNPVDIIQILNRIKSEKLALILIDREDYNRSLAHDIAKDLFKTS